MAHEEKSNGDKMKMKKSKSLNIMQSNGLVLDAINFKVTKDDIKTTKETYSIQCEGLTHKQEQKVIDNIYNVSIYTISSGLLIYIYRIYGKH